MAMIPPPFLTSDQSQLLIFRAARTAGRATAASKIQRESALDL
jgi:hypothetical protein